jgi:hypothetical protein
MVGRILGTVAPDPGLNERLAGVQDLTANLSMVNEVLVILYFRRR